MLASRARLTGWKSSLAAVLLGLGVMVCSGGGGGNNECNQQQISNPDCGPPPPPPPSYTLSLTPTGGGSGRVSAPAVGNVPALECVITSGAGSGCSAQYPRGTAVSLTATPQTGSVFAGWQPPVEGTCTGMASPCSVTLSANATLSPSFTLAVGTLRIVATGLPSGAVAQGTVTGPGNFSQAFTGNAVFPGLVTGSYLVTPSPVTSSGMTYTAPAQTGVVTAGQEVTVSIVYGGPATRVLTIAGGGVGTGSGRVTSTPAGIDCVITNGAASGMCAATFATDTPVQVQVVTGTLTSWSDACSGAGACQVTMNQDKRVVATFAAIAPSIVLKTTKPVIATNFITTRLFEYYAIQNGGGGALMPTVAPAQPTAWMQVSVVDSTLKVDIDITKATLRPTSEHDSPHIATVFISSPGAQTQQMDIKFARSFDRPAGMAATRVRFHRSSVFPEAPPAPNISALVSLLDSRTNTAIAADRFEVQPPNQNWLETPRINSSGQLELRVKQVIGATIPGGGFDDPIRIKLFKTGVGSPCPDFAVDPDPQCHVFVAYTADPFPKFLLRPWGVQLTANQDTASVAIEVQQTEPQYSITPTFTVHSCQEKLTVTAFTSTLISVKGNFATIPADSLVRCMVSIGHEVRNANQGGVVVQSEFSTQLEVRLVRTGADFITPSHRNLNIVVAARSQATKSDTIKVNNLGPNVITLSPPTFATNACPAGLLGAPTLDTGTVGKGTEAKLTISVNPQNHGVQECTADLRLASTTPGVVAESIPIKVILKD